MLLKGKLIKVSITAFKNDSFQKLAEIDPNKIYLHVNPESLTQNFSIKYNKQQAQGSQLTNPHYEKTVPEELKLDFTLDGTNTIQGYKYSSDDHSVKGQLDVFMNTVYKMNGKTHRPNFLEVQWGKDFLFACILSNLDLNYTLFSPNGDPLRIKVSATFLSYLAQKERSVREGKESPDLTHIRQVKAGDRLDAMTSDIYNDPKYVTQIARANGLLTFRQLSPGLQVNFPPLDKTTTS